jgi:hypothetical protein
MQPIRVPLVFMAVTEKCVIALLPQLALKRRIGERKNRSAGWRDFQDVDLRLKLEKNAHRILMSKGDAHTHTAHSSSA